MVTPTKCPVCDGQVYRNSRGQILGHTTAGKSYPYQAPEVCPGGNVKARP